MKLNSRHDLTGNQFGDFLAIEIDFIDKSGRCFWKCRCIKCNKITSKRIDHLKQNPKCFITRNRASVAKDLGIDRITHARLRAVFAQMKARCFNPTHYNYKNYGGRGILVDPRWNKSSDFIKDMYPSYRHGLEIDRRDNNSGYSPENCRWVTRLVNARNKRKPAKLSRAVQ
jgi:hypothetical protein